MAANKRQKKKQLKAQSLTEFRAWLSGVEEMQEDGWVPNSTQWELIRERIDKIKIDDVQDLGQVTPPQSTQRPSGPAIMNNQPDPGLEIPQVPSTFDRAGAAGNFVPNETNQPKIPHAVDPKKPVTTPEIDTSNGDYKSGFL